MRYWRNYTEGRTAHTVVGTLNVRRGLRSPQLRNRRDLYVYLPPSYDSSERRYPVIYMHDGQNLFDQELSYAGEWQVDETLTALVREGIEAIVVGIPNAGRHRLDEYGPFRDEHLGAGGRGDSYLAFIIETIKPLIDSDFRSLPDRAHTGIMGSSMGGLISLYAFFRHPDIFGFAGVMSPSLWFAQQTIFPYVEAAPFVPGKLHLDVGTREGPDESEPQSLPHTFVGRHALNLRRMHDMLLAKGYRDEHELNYVEESEAVHHESAWARRLPGALRFLLT